MSFFFEAKSSLFTDGTCFAMSMKEKQVSFNCHLVSPAWLLRAVGFIPLSASSAGYLQSVIIDAN